MSGQRLLRVGLVGVGGYGRTHLEGSARLHAEGRINLVAYADVAPTAAALVESVFDGPIRAYGSDAEMLDAEDLDVVVIGAPIPLHAPMLERALSRGVSALVEKPPVVTVQDLDRLLALQRETGAHCQVGFQTARTPAMAAVASAISAGVLGEIELIGSIGRSVRSDSYYARAAWAGRLVHAGAFVLDGTLTNPLAHALMNCLLLAGSLDGGDASAIPARVQAELYRCRDSISGDDTSSVRIETTHGRTVVLASTLCASRQLAPSVFVRGSRASVRLFYTDGRVECDPEGVVSVPPADGVDRHGLLADLIDVVSGRKAELLCPLSLCRGFVLTLNGMYESAGAPSLVPSRFLAFDEPSDRIVRLAGIDELAERSALRGQLYSEAGAEWAQSTKAFSLEGYERFELFEST